MDPCPGCRVWLDASALHNSSYKQCCIYIDYTKETTVSDVEKHVCRVLGLDLKISLLNDGWLLLSSESSRVFSNNDIISIVSSEDSEYNGAKRSRENDDSCVLLKIRKKNKNKLKDDELVQKDCEVSKANQEKNEVENSDPVETHLFNGKETSCIQSDEETTTFCDTQVPACEKDLDVTSASDLNQSKKSKRKRTRRRKKTVACVQKEIRKKESPFLVNKRLQGVSHVLASLTGGNNHVFFTDDTEGSTVPLQYCHTEETTKSSQRMLGVETSGETHSNVKGKSTLLPQSISRECITSHFPPKIAETLSSVANCHEIPFTSPVPSINGSHSVSCHSSAGVLSKLMSFADERLIPVFERKKQFSPSTVQTVESKTNLPPKLEDIQDIPAKESIIKFKVLKMVNYSPELSKEITAEVTSTDLTTRQLCLKVLDGREEFQEEKGKFSLEDETEDANLGSDNFVYLNWNEMLEPKKLVL